MACSTTPEMKDEEIYKALEPTLTDINKQYIAMETSEKSSSVQIILKVLDELITKMKEASKPFEWLYNKVTYVGSYYDGLRVKKATEFDINVVLKLPLNYEKIIIDRTSKYPGFVEIKVDNAKFSGEKLTKHQNETTEVFKWVNEEGKLSHSSVLQWWESIFSKLQGPTTLMVDNSEYKITDFKKSGPAMTAHISGENVDIDIDLVAVIEFPATMRPPHPIRWKNQEGLWYVVPKPHEESKFLWRLSFPAQEQNVIHGLYNLKLINRFLKRVRDVFKWPRLTSYYIKSIFLWEAHERRLKKDEAFFNKNLGYLFVYFLRKLQGYLQQKNLPFFWDEDMNLLVKINPPTLEQFAMRIKKVTDKLETFLLEKKTDRLQEYMATLFSSNSSGNKSGAVEKAGGGFSLIDLSDDSEQLPTPELSVLQSFDLLSSTQNQDSLVSSTVDLSGNLPTKYAFDLEAAKEKRALEIEECKIRIQVAQIDLKTAEMNLRAAEKRYEKADLDLKMAYRLNNVTKPIQPLFET